MKRGVTAAAMGVVIAASIALTGCTSDTAVGGKTELNLLTWDNGETNRAAWQTVVDGFNDSQEDVTVSYEVINTDRYDEVLKTRLSGGEGPDLFTIHPVTTQELAGADFLYAVDDEPWFADMTEAAQNYPIDTGDGKAYTFPIATGISGMIYNKALFADAGIAEVPTTWDELLDACAKLQAAGYQPFSVGIKDAWFVQMQFYQLLVQETAGPDPQLENNIAAGDGTFSDSKGWHHALELYQQLVPYFLPDPLGSGEQAAQAAFLQGQAAMFPSDYIVPAGTEAGIDMGQLVFPTTDSAPKYYWGGFPYSMALNAENGKEAAASEFVSYLLSADVYPGLLEALSAFPVIDGIDVKLAPVYNEARTNVEGKTIVDPWAADHWNPGVSDEFLAAMQDLTAGRATPDEVLSRMDAANALALENQ